jgi:hypothetical protein
MLNYNRDLNPACYLTKHIKGGRIYFGQRFLSMVTWLHCFWAVMIQNIMAGACGRAELLTSWKLRKRDRGGKRERERKTKDKIYPSKTYPQ